MNSKQLLFYYLVKDAQEFLAPFSELARDCQMPLLETGFPPTKFPFATQFPGNHHTALCSRTRVVCKHWYLKEIVINIVRRFQSEKHVAVPLTSGFRPPLPLWLPTISFQISLGQQDGREKSSYALSSSFFPPVNF